MTDPQNPAAPEPQQPASQPTAPPPPAASSAPSAYDAPPSPPAYGGAPAYSSAPPAAYGASADQPVPGKTLGIVAFILSFFVQLVALILGIVALVQSRKAGVKNGWALAAIIVSSVLIVVGIIVAIIVVTVVFGGIAAACNELGPGVWELEGGGTITCN
ncbi:DUF4190 domain-containing protein [Microbacterium aurantiacum]|uniref:DUF4190 domain-containing protein n=1 Tax=Microbacterium aurantiacum TaxID=162393 RepID=UPI003F4922B8